MSNILPFLSVNSSTLVGTVSFVHACLHFVAGGRICVMNNQRLWSRQKAKGRRDDEGSRHSIFIKGSLEGNGPGTRTRNEIVDICGRQEKQSDWKNDISNAAEEVILAHNAMDDLAFSYDENLFDAQLEVIEKASVATAFQLKMDNDTTKKEE